MIVEGVDPRDSEWEVEGPVYRVYLWHQLRTPASLPRENLMLHGDEYRLSRVADVGEVIDWARATARPDQTFTIYVQHRDENGLGLIHLMGIDPTKSTTHRAKGLCVLVIPVDGEREFYLDAHIAGVRDGKLVIANGPVRMNGLDPISDVLREIPLAEIQRVEILEEAGDDW